MTWIIAVYVMVGGFCGICAGLADCANRDWIPGRSEWPMRIIGSVVVAVFWPIMVFQAWRDQ